MKNVYLITGKDARSIEEEARKLVKDITSDKNDSFNLEIYKESDDHSIAQTLEEALISLSTPPFLSENKTIWLQNIPLTTITDDAVESKNNAPLTRCRERLVDFISKSFPNDITLIISGVGCNPKSHLYASCSKVGKVISFSKPDLHSKFWREDIRQIIRNKTKELGMNLMNEVIEYLIEVVGVDTDRLANEIEKIYCYMGQNPTMAHVQDLCTGNREAVYFALSNAIGERNINTALKTITQLLGHSKDPEGLVIGQVRYLSRFIKELVEAKLLMSYYKIRIGKQLGVVVSKMTLEEKERFKTSTILSKSNWRIGILASYAEKYTGPELVKAVTSVAYADKMLVSSSLQKRLILEMLIIRIIVGEK